MSVFDQSFRKPSGGCFGICNGNGDRQPLSTAVQNRVEDDLKTSEEREKMRTIDAMLSQAMSGLTFNERQEQLDLLHGVDKKIVENEEFIEASLQLLDRQLEQIKNSTVYEIAERLDPAYVKSRAIRLMFLRGNRYDIKDTAEKMVKFFECKRQLFGAEKLVKDITLDDLDEKDIAAIKAGSFQLAGKDRAGRVLFINFPGLRGNVSLQNELRMRYYILMSALEGEKNQPCHTVPIIFSVGDMREPFGGSGFFENAKVSNSIPHFMAAMHLCTDGKKEYLVQDLILKAAPAKLRSRSRLHFGSQTECLYQLSTYGIPRDIIPLDPITGEISLKRHLAWVESRFALEKKSKSPVPGIIPSLVPSSSAIIPGDNDVLVGTGKTSGNMGNQLLRQMVKGLSQAYASSNKQGKQELVDRVINSVQQSGGRFLKEEQLDGWNVSWKEMPKRDIRKNVQQAFRNSYRRR